MIGNNVQFKSRSVIALLLAVLVLTLAATPALAWFDEGDIEGKPVLPCQVISDGAGGHTVYCFKQVHHHTRPVAEQPLLRPSIAKAELMFVADQQLAQQ